MSVAVCCHPPSSKPSPNVLLISIDTLRPDHLGSYGYARPTSPHLDRLAGQGTRFERAYAQSGWTLPSHTSLLTAQYPEVHGVWHDGVALGAGVTTLAEQLRSLGLQTGAVVSFDYVGSRFGLDQGFDRFVELSARRHQVAATGSGVDAEEVTDAALNLWAERDPTRSQFLFVHYFDPHADYQAPVPYESKWDRDYVGPARGSIAWLRPFVRHLRLDGSLPPPLSRLDAAHVVALYDGEISYVDSQIGRLLATLESRTDDEWLIIVVGDHGEEFMEHGSMEGHGWTLYDEVIRVPLILRPPKGGGARVVESTVELIDVAPTILELLGGAVSSETQGRSLVPLLRDPEAPWRDTAFSETRRFTSKLAVVSGRYKLIYSADQPKNHVFLPDPPGVQLFDLVADPSEQRDLAVELPDVRDELLTLLDAWRHTNENLAATPAVRIELSTEERDRLRSLGYL